MPAGKTFETAASPAVTDECRACADPPLHTGLTGQENDGLVAQDSAPCGNFQTPFWSCDHVDMVGHNLDTADLGNFQFDHFAAFEAVIIAFTQALAGLGWTEGRKMRMDLRGSGEDTNRM